MEGGVAGLQDRLRGLFIALITIIGGIIGQHGRLVANRDLVVDLSLRLVMNNLGRGLPHYPSINNNAKSARLSFLATPPYSMI